MKKYFFLVAIVVFFSSCEGDQFVKYRFTGLIVNNINSSPGLPVLDNSDSIRKEIYGIRLNLYPVETERKGRRFDSYESGVAPEDPVADIDITCSDSFDLTHPAGADVTGYFMYVAGNYFHCFDLNDGSEFTPTAKYNNDYEDNNLPEYADLLLTDMPNNFVYRKFYVKLKYQSGYFRIDSTTLVKLY